MRWEENRSRDSLAPKLIFQDYQSDHESNGEVNQVSHGMDSKASDTTKNPDPILISTSAAEVSSDAVLCKTSSRTWRNPQHHQ